MSRLQVLREMLGDSMGVLTERAGPIFVKPRAVSGEVEQKLIRAMIRNFDRILADAVRQSYYLQGQVKHAKKDPAPLIDHDWTKAVAETKAISDALADIGRRLERVDIGTKVW